MSKPGAKRHALITGGTRGIGEGIARALALADFTVTACGLTAGECEGFEPQPGIATRILDVTDQRSTDAAVAACPRLDLLVNCAGIIQRNGAEFEIEAFKKTIDVNLHGTMRMCLAAREKLAANGGSIIMIASIMSFRGSPYAPAYAASKGGVAQLAKSLGAAWAAEGIRVNAIAPGWIATDLTRPLQDDPEKSGDILGRTPMHRWGTPADLGDVALFLASDAARFITGAVLPVDGGYLAN
jgi:NAD(P)-dependent dehydrogenase (short-subunit alcohol dehydrogenase family)